jgi:hypothetical protein
MPSRDGVFLFLREDLGRERGGFGNREVPTVAEESSREGGSPFVGANVVSE